MRGIGNDRMVYPMRGSNNFILGPNLTADGNVIIGNDTHLSLSNPPIFYLVQLVATGGEVPVNAMGVNFPAFPASFSAPTSTWPGRRRTITST